MKTIQNNIPTNKSFLNVPKPSFCGTKRVFEQTATDTFKKSFASYSLDELDLMVFELSNKIRVLTKKAKTIFTKTAQGINSRELELAQIKKEEITKEIDKRQAQNFKKIFKNAPPPPIIINITNKDTGKPQSAIIKYAPARSTGDYRLEVFSNKELVGLLEIIQNLNSNALKLEYLATSEKFKGLGKELIKKAIVKSKNSGHKGNLELIASNADMPEEYVKLAGRKNGSSPVEFYNKCGFEFNDYGIMILSEEKHKTY